MQKGRSTRAGRPKTGHFFFWFLKGKTRCLFAGPFQGSDVRCLPTRNAPMAPSTEPVQATRVPSHRPSVKPAISTKRAPGRKSTVNSACTDANAKLLYIGLRFRIHAKILLNLVVVGSQKPTPIKPATKTIQYHRFINGHAFVAHQCVNTSQRPCNDEGQPWLHPQRHISLRSG